MLFAKCPRQRTPWRACEECTIEDPRNDDPKVEKLQRHDTETCPKDVKNLLEMCSIKK